MPVPAVARRTAPTYIGGLNDFTEKTVLRLRRGTLMVNVLDCLADSCANCVRSVKGEDEDEDEEYDGSGSAGPNINLEAVMERVTTASGDPPGSSDAALLMGISGVCGWGSGTAMALAVILGLERMVVKIEKQKRRFMMRKKVCRANGDDEMAFFLLTLMLNLDSCLDG